jgi:hypothetical protein
MKVYPIGTRVILESLAVGLDERRGTVVGFTQMTSVEETGRMALSSYYVYLVQLDNGFYNEDKTTFVSTIVVSVDGVRKENE